MTHVYIFFLVVLLIFVLPENVESGNNIGVIFHSMTSNQKNDTCGVSGCSYFMKICLSLGENNNCSLGNFTTISWMIKPGGNKTFKWFKKLTASGLYNPYIKTVDTWPKQVVKLNASIWKNSGHASVYIEQHYFQTKLPYPTNDYAIKIRTQLRSCDKHFCVTMQFYMWCDVLSDCVDFSSSIYQSSKTFSIYSFVSTAITPILNNTTLLIQQTLVTSKSEEINTTLKNMFTMTKQNNISGLTSVIPSIQLTLMTSKSQEINTTMKNMFTMTKQTNISGLTSVIPLIRQTLMTSKSQEINTTMKNMFTMTKQNNISGSFIRQTLMVTSVLESQSTRRVLATSEQGQESTNPNTNSASNVILPTVTQSFSRSVSNAQNKTNKLKIVLKSWWFILSVIVGGLLVVLGIILVMMRCKKNSGHTNIITINMGQLKT